jgi:hypothetical protein
MENNSSEIREDSCKSEIIKKKRTGDETDFWWKWQSFPPKSICSRLVYPRQVLDLQSGTLYSRAFEFALLYFLWKNRNWASLPQFHDHSITNSELLVFQPDDGPRKIWMNINEKIIDGRDKKRESLTNPGE